MFFQRAIVKTYYWENSFENELFENFWKFYKMHFLNVFFVKSNFENIFFEEAILKQYFWKKFLRGDFLKCILQGVIFKIYFFREPIWKYIFWRSNFANIVFDRVILKINFGNIFFGGKKFENAFYNGGILIKTSDDCLLGCLLMGISDTL